MATAAYGVNELKPFEAPVLIAWARRIVAAATKEIDAASAADATCYGLHVAKNRLDLARRNLDSAERHVGPSVTVATDRADFGVDSITFGVRENVWSACCDAADAMAWLRKGSDQLARNAEWTAETARQYAHLTRNIAVEA